MRVVLVKLGENLNLQDFAEGIETAAQLRKLRELGCTLGQGYLSARPLEARLAADFLTNGAAAIFDVTTPPTILSTPDLIDLPNLQ